MFVLAVTGGAGAGKSEAARYFAGRGALVVGLDEMAKSTIEPDGDAYQEVVDAFGQDILDSNGRVRPDVLAERAFHDEASAARLNAIVHPRVAVELRRLLLGLEQLDVPPEVVVVEVPLLTEVPEMFEIFDYVLDIEADPRVRVARVVARGMDEADALRRMARQPTAEERASISDSVIRNDGDQAQLRRQLEAFWDGEVVPRVA